jgi:lauroyl/myristoyl acyltransferase
LNTLARLCLGYLAVAAILTIRRLPESISLAAVIFLLPLYLTLRCRHSFQVRNRLAASPFNMGLWGYYSARARLLVRSIREHGPAWEAAAPTEIRNRDILDTALADRRPILLCGLHLGLFERLHQVPHLSAQRQGRQTLVVTAPAFSPVLDNYMSRGRNCPGKATVANRNLAGAVKRTLRTRGILAVMLDQYPSRRGETLTLWNSISLPCSTKLVSRMAINGALILPVSTWLKADGRSVLMYHPPLAVKPGAGNEDNAWKGLFQQFLEREIARAPRQWNWSYPGIKIVS